MTADDACRPRFTPCAPDFRKDDSSASLHDLVELHWHSICMSQAAQGSDLVRGITIVPSSCLRVGAHEIELSARRRQ